MSIPTDPLRTCTPNSPPDAPAGLGELSVLVTGAAGFIGINLVKALAPRCRRLICYGRRAQEILSPLGLPGTECHTGETGDIDRLGPLLHGVDRVIHLASSSTPVNADWDLVTDAEQNVLTTLKLFRACLAAGVGRVVFVSSGGTVYGPGAVVPTPESAPTDPITAYGVAKVAIEKYLHVFRHLHHLDYRVLRVANPYGPYQLATKGQGIIGAFIRKALAGQPLEIWGDGSTVRDYVYIDDLTDALLRAAVHDGPGRVFNVGSGRGTTINEVADTLEAVLGRRLERLYHPPRPVDVPVSVLDCAAAWREMGWRATTPLADGMTDTLRWFTRHVTPPGASA
uniref:NAD-dependent epimerase/dehydratase n=1 Tax=Nitratidesulfovibrio vulgaris (strain DSM 19637 / Miyazaki F) TaxID=883 RepID=B8DSA4_NITV9